MCLSASHQLPMPIVNTSKAVAAPGDRGQDDGTPARFATALPHSSHNPPNHTLTWRSMTDIGGLRSSEEMPGGFSCQSP